MCGMAQAEVDDPGRPEPAALAEDRLHARIVGLRVPDVPLLVPEEVVAGERAGGLANVGLGVVADTEREELHQFAGEVLVRVLLRRADHVEPPLHRVVVEHRERQIAEVPERVSPQQPVLGDHQARIADLVVRRREVIVEVQRHPLDQRRPGSDHAVEPPGDIVAVLVERLEPAPVNRPGTACEGVRAGGVQEVPDGGVEAVAAEARTLRDRWPEAGTPEQAVELAAEKGISPSCHPDKGCTIPPATLRQINRQLR